MALTHNRTPKLIARRAILRMSAAGAAALVGRVALATPAIVQGEITPQQFGARGGDAVADTRGWNEAVKQAAATGRQVVARGTYVLRVPSVSRWNWGGNAAAPTHVAVQLLSGTHIAGKDAQILVGRPEKPPSERAERHFLFGTGHNASLGTLRDITIDGLTFDFRNEFGEVHPFTYAEGVMGVDDFRRRNLTLRSSSVRAGRGLLTANIRRRSDENIKHENIVQGIFSQYEYGVSMRHITFDGFAEALDFDGPCWDVVLDDLSFRNGDGEAQCIDTGGGARWSITNVTAENVSSVVYIYFKPTSRPTYKAWLDGGSARTKDYVRPEDFTISGVRVETSHKRKSEKHPDSLRIGNIRNERSSKRTPYAGGPRNIIVEDWIQDGGGQIVVTDCENLTMSRIALSNIKAPDDSVTGAALVLSEPKAVFGGQITGRVSDVTIRHSQGMGVSAVGGGRLSLSNIVVDGYNLAHGKKTGAGIRLRPQEGAQQGPAIRASKVTGGTPGGMDLDQQRP